ncbi:MAG: hypothetical protein ACXADB_07805 [Candidatus Hermodarchaeia archaeon]|jgi:hypothetical protein
MSFVLPPPGSEVLLGTGVVDVTEDKEFEDEWDLTATSVLGMLLEKDCEWTSKTDKSTLIIQKLATRVDGVRCVECRDEDTGHMVFISIRGLLDQYTPPSIQLSYMGHYGATCVKCNQHFEYQKKSRAFVCWACKNGY